MSTRVKYVRDTDIKITRAIAVINPCNIARLSTTSTNPSRKKPSKNDISPDYDFDRPSEICSDCAIPRDIAYLDGDDSCYSNCYRFRVIDRRMGVLKSND